MACNCEKCGGRILGLAHIGIMISDIAKSKEFYMDKLGFSLTGEYSSGEVTLIFLALGDAKLELVYNSKNGPRADGKVDHVAFLVEDIETVVCKLIEKQIHFLSDSITESGFIPGMRNIFFTGPDGERLEFMEYPR